MSDNNFYPFQGQFLDLDGLQYHYLDEGPKDAPPVIMLHGNPSWSIYYRNLVNLLSKNFRCIVPDHIGCGLSDKPDDAQYDYTLDRRVADLNKLVEHLGLGDNITLVVHDWGGMIGMAWASLHPDLVKRFVIFNTSAFRLPPSKSFPVGLWICRNTALGTFLVRGFNAFSAGAAWVGCKRKRMPRALRHAYTRPYNSWKNRIATLRFVQDIPLASTDRNYTTVCGVESGLGRFSELPMLICWGLKDFVFDKHFLKLWTNAFPKAEVHRFEDCGHYILEDASDEILPLVEKFLEKNPLQ